MTGLEIDLDLYPDEARLLEALRRKDKLACDCLLKRYASHVYNVGLRLTTHPDEAEEVLQETFISACAKVGDFEGRSGLGTWLYRIATNAALMRLRRRKLETVSLDAVVEPAGDTPMGQDIADLQHEPGLQILSAELRRVVDEALTQLPEALRSVFILREIEGLSTAEVAETLHISESAAKVRLHRAKHALREHIAGYFELGPREGARD